MPLKSKDDTLFIAAPSMSKVPAGDKLKLAEQRLFQTALTKIKSVTSSSEVTIDELQGYELVADAVHSDTGSPLILYQVMLFESGSYILIQGRVGAHLGSEFLPSFKGMAKSLRRTRR